MPGIMNTRQDISSLRKGAYYECLYNSLSNVPYFANTLYLFVRDNLKDIVCMGYLFGVLNATIAFKFSMGPALHITEIILTTHRMILWSLSNLLLFNLHNQRHPSAVLEDRQNKPWRPLPAGRISPKQTTHLIFAMYPVILLISYKWGGMIPCLLEAFSCLWYNEWGGAADPFLKNLLNGVGFACFFAGPLEVLTRESIFSGQGKAATWLGILTACITTTVHTQDFRDVRGDRAAGRITVPLSIGDTAARLLVAVGVCGWTLAASWYWEAGKQALVAVLAGGIMVCNLFWDRTTEGDSRTWKLWPAWIFGLFLVPVIPGRW
ncbi:hypothetical protein FHL15_005368 [Xylaria flabelliformis]|uniref:Uncharacterized protein n=1 Tax=Xylaria flabelliformis TaxID=2512241 RepID=A0A553I0H5_9PEZI|nr:hypothetical protein FHL15_005368 [Xylaria flabelliformis]